MAVKPIALAKLTRPRLHDVVARTRLDRELDVACKRPVVWLCAQPGAGKTTLVAGHLAQCKRAGIWYQVDSADSDPASFVYHLRLAAVAACSGAAAKAAQALPLLTPDHMADLRSFARRFFRDLFACLDATAALVLDNLQEAADTSDLHRMLAEGMAQIPPGQNVFALSRAQPPVAYAVVLAGDAMAVVDGAALRLTRDETQAIAERRGVRDAARCAALHERCQGWAAGLTLLLTRTRSPSQDAPEDEAEELQHVFGYFAQRVLDDAAPEARLALMQLSCMPLMTATLAERLTGLPDAARLPEQLYRKHLFTDRRRVGSAKDGAAAYVYQFHALFRSFLQHQALDALGAQVLAHTQARAAALLSADGHWEPALDLLAASSDWDAYAALITRKAESLLEQGRRQTLIDWMARLPDAARDRDPWTGYWQARALSVVMPDRAVQMLDASGARFAEMGDAAGQLACGAGVVQALWYARLGWSEITPRVDKLEGLIDSAPVFPSIGVELLSYAPLHAALAFCRPAHPVLAPLARRLLGLVDATDVDWNHRIATATHLITYFHNAAEYDLATQLIAKVDTAVETLQASARNRAYWFVFRAIHDIRHARPDMAAQRFQRAEELAREEGLAHAEFAALQFHAYLDLMCRRLDDAEGRIARMEMHPARSNPDGEMNFRVAQTMLAQWHGDTARALRHAELGLQAVERIGAVYFQAVYPVLFASALADAGQHDRARAIITSAQALAHGSYLQTMEASLMLEEAYVCLAEGDTAAAHAGLARGLGLAAADPQRAAHVHRIIARKPVLLHEALKAGIETGYVRRVIRQWQVAPPAEEVAQWPWPVRVFTLGTFEVQLDDKPIEFGRKAPKKTLSLLKAIIARGGSASDAALIDTFWPDEAGDVAAKSLAAAVHRLRQLLGSTQAVVQQGNLVSLDRGIVWVDAWTFERGLDARDASPDEDRVTQALALYRGAFLAEDEGEPWPVAMRERLRSRFVQTVADHAARLEAAQRDDEATRWYLRGLDADNVVEPFYQGLMRCYQRLDRMPEAVAAYRRLKQILSVTLSLAPSAATERLYRNLRLASAGSRINSE